MTNSFGETTHLGIFAAGDVVLGAKTVVQAAAYAKMVADAMDKYMRRELAEARRPNAVSEFPSNPSPA